MKQKRHEYVYRQHMLTTDFEVFHYADVNISGVSLHHHDFYECYLFLGGDVTYLIEGKSYLLKPGDIVLVNTKELHQAIINKNGTMYDRIVLWLSKSFVGELSTNEINLSRCFEDKHRKNVLRGNIEVQQSIKSLLTKIIGLEEYKGIGKTLLYKSYLTEILVYLNNVALTKDVELGTDLKKSNLIDRINDFINDHIEEDITLDRIAEEFYVSKFHLSREFKVYTGTTLHKYIVKKKLIMAKELILQGIPIIEVYKVCGMGDYSNFFRAFKSEYGVTPKQYYKLMLK